MATASSRLADDAHCKLAVTDKATAYPPRRAVVVMKLEGEAFAEPYPIGCYEPDAATVVA
jgi:hypothetical protein